LVGPGTKEGKLCKPHGSKSFHPAVTGCQTRRLKKRKKMRLLEKRKEGVFGKRIAFYLGRGDRIGNVGAPDVCGKNLFL